MQIKSLQWIIVAISVVFISGCVTSMDTKQLITKHENLDLISRYSYNSKNSRWMANKSSHTTYRLTKLTI